MSFLREVNLILEKVGSYKPINLPYSLNALEPVVNRQTTDFHYNKHYKGYVKKLNVAMGNRRKKPLVELVKDIKNYNDKVALFPMAMEIEFTTDTATVFTDLLHEAKLDDDLLRTLVYIDSNQLSPITRDESAAVRAALGDITTFEVADQGLGPPGTFNESTILFEKREHVFLNSDQMAPGVLNSYAETKPSKPRLTLDLTKWFNAYKDGTVSSLLTSDRGAFTNSGLFLKEYNDAPPENECDALTRQIRSIIFMGRFRQFIEDHARTWQQVMEGETAYSETLMYRIAKYKGSETDIPFQNIYIANSSDIEMAKYIDTQVAYDENYSYKIFAYQLVVGNKYNYDFDFTATPPSQVVPHTTSGFTNGKLRIDEDTGYVVLDFAAPIPGPNDLTGERAVLYNLYGWITQYHAQGNPLVVSIQGSDQPGYSLGLASKGVSGTSNNPRYWRIRVDEEAFPPIPYDDGHGNIGEAWVTAIIDIPPEKLPTGTGDVNFKVHRVTKIQGQLSVTGQNPEYPVFNTEIGTTGNHTGKVFARVHSQPSVIITEVEYGPTLTERIVDKPPVFPNVDIVPFRGIDNKVLINLDTHAGEYNHVPVIIEDGDDLLFNRVRTNQKKTIPGTRVTFKTDDPAASFEVFRLDTHPASPQDFRGNKIATIDTNGASSASLVDKIQPNTKYYYIFRAIDVHGNISNPTQFPYRVELINNDGAIYSRVETVEYSTETNPNRQESRTLKKFIRIAPSTQQSMIDVEGTTPLGGTLKAKSSAHNSFARLGAADKSIWGEKIKIRFTSKFTGKRFDLNLRFNQEWKQSAQGALPSPSPGPTED